MKKSRNKIKLKSLLLYKKADSTYILNHHTIHYFEGNQYYIKHRKEVLSKIKN